MRRKTLWNRVVYTLCTVTILYILGTAMLINRDGVGFITNGLYKSILYPARRLFDQNGALPTPNTTYVAPKKAPVRRVFKFNINCAAIIAGDKTEIHRANAYMKAIYIIHKTRNRINDSDYIRLTKDCQAFRNSRGYFDMSLSIEEKDFSIAYSILLYKDVEQAERLLRAIYQPQNVYCLHVDADAKPPVHKATQGIADCFHNVFVVSRKEYIIYSGFTRLQADLNCMQNLLDLGVTWKYFINLPSQQFPVKTNSEIVKILKAYNGANDIEGVLGGRQLKSRFQYSHVYKGKDPSKKSHLVKTEILKVPPPFNISVVKGSAYGIFSRAFVKFICDNRVARLLLDWFRDVNSPDEYYWATLNHNPQIGVPGAYKGKADDKPWLAVYAEWGGPCGGKYVRGICVFGVGDLQKLVRKDELFVNKFFIDYKPLALDCIEEWYYNRTVTPLSSTLNITYYQSLPFVHNHIT